MTIEFLSATAYAKHKGDPIEAAVDLVAVLAEVHQEVLAGRVTNPSGFPSWPQRNLPDYVARRFVATLLDAGWTPPADADIAEAIACLPVDLGGEGKSPAPRPKDVS